MKKILFTLFVLGTLVSYAQKQASNWYFGDNAGIQFDIDAGTLTAVTDGQLGTVEGCTSISDVDGNLVLYTDGSVVYNANHVVMQNGTGLLGDESSSQSALVVPKPDDPNIYYIFTVGSNQNPTGLNYSEVDLTLSSGLGAVTANKNVPLLSSASEKISAVLKDCNTGNIWVIGFSNVNGNSTGSLNAFHAFEVSNTGVSNAAVVSSFLGTLSVSDLRGNLKFSPDGTRLACANSTSGLFIADFDTASGIVTNPQFLTIQSSSNDNPYGVEFSPNSQLLYVASSNDFFSQTPGQNNNPSNHSSSLLQYDLNATNISGSQVVLDNRQLYRGSLQLGPDGRIYRALSATYNQGTNTLGVINNPNVLGTGADYQHAAISLNARLSRQGLPPFIQSFFVQQIDIIQNGTSTTQLNLCDGDNYTLMADDITGATYTWTQDGNPLTESDFDLLVTEAGDYAVLIDLNTGNCSTLEGVANVNFFDAPVANPAPPLAVCDDDGDNIMLFDLTQLDAAILLAQDPNLFTVRYFETLDNANNFLFEITGNYQNTSQTQTLYARVENNDFFSCFDVVPITIEVYALPVVASTTDFEACDDNVDGDDTNGQANITLSDFNSTVLGTQNVGLFTISYHSSQNDADTNTSPLPNTYYNQTPFSETIFVRIENNSSAVCFSTDSFTVNINPIPDAFNASLFQCDEDGIADGFTVFNLNEANDDLNGNTTGRSTLFYDSLNDAQNDIGQINGDAYSNASNPETLYVRVIDDATGCYRISELELEVSATQINDYVAAPVCDELDSEDGLNTFNLDDFSTDILSGLPPGLNINYYENYNDALLEQNVLSSPYSNTTPYSQTIYVRVENDNACYGINEVQLTVNPLPELEPDETLLYCLNEFPVLVTIDGGVLNDSPNNYTYSWSSGENTIEIEVNTIGNYTVTVTNIFGCSKQRTITLEASNIATINGIEIIDGSLNNNTVTVLASGEGTYEYALINAEGQATPYQSNNVFVNMAPGIYTVSVRDVKNNCGIVDDLISVIGFPVYFTPNGDGVHDYWQVYGLNSQFQPNSQILIFDRYGKLLAEVSPSSQGWDGNHNGKPLPTNDYWFTVTLQDGRIYNDHFTLKR